MKKILKKLFLLSVIYTIVSCQSIDQVITRLPPDPDRVTLTDNSNTNEIILILQCFRNDYWRLTARYLVGEIDYEEYKYKEKEILGKIDQVNEQFK